MNKRSSHLASNAMIDLQALLRWASLCALVGACAGMAAAGFVTAVDFLQAAVLRDLLGVSILDGQTASEASNPAGWSRWLLPLIPAVGGLVVALLASLFGSEVYGGGTDSVLQAYHRRGGRLSWRVPIGKWLASTVTLGTGGSAGREGPMTLVCGGIGSVLAQWFGVGEKERRLLLLAGAGAGVGAVFRVPLGSAIFAIELLYRDGFEEEGIFPCLIASVTSFAVFVAVHGTGQLFELPPFPPLALRTLPFFAIVGLAVVPFGYLFTAALRRVPRIFASLGIPRFWRPAIGGLIVGSLGLVSPQLLGIGYGWVQSVLAPVEGGAASWSSVGLFLAYAVAKIVATSITVGSGGSGGTFAPSVVAGGFVGGAVGHAVHTMWPHHAPVPAAFALVGMSAMLGGIAHVPLAAVIIVCELAGNYQLLVPLMAAGGVAFLLLRRTTLYPEQARSPATSPARVGGIALEVLDTLRVSDMDSLRAAPPPIAPNMKIAELIAQFGRDRVNTLALQSEDGLIREMVTLKALRSILDFNPIWTHLMAMDASSPALIARRGDSLRTVMELLMANNAEEAFVVDDSGGVIGIVGHVDVAQLALREAVRRRTTGDDEPSNAQ